MTTISVDDKIQCEFCFQYIPSNKVIRHSNVCDAKKMLTKSKSLPFYHENINLFPATKQIFERTDFTELIEFDLFNKINSVYDEYIGSIKQIKDCSNECSSLLDIKKGGENRTKKSLRHREQEASIVYHMKCNNLVDEVGTFIEMGAGKGMLSQAIGLERPDARFVCVERSAYKTKAENMLRNHFRARVDLQHVDLFSLLQHCDVELGDRLEDTMAGEVHNNQHTNDGTSSSYRKIAHSHKANAGSVNNASAVCVGKHLCGAATDLALMAMKRLHEQSRVVESQNINSSTDTNPPLSGSTPQLAGFAIATCCHSSCDFDNCAAKEFLVSCGITAEDFRVMRRWAGFFTVDDQQRLLEQQRAALHSSEALLGEASTETAVEVADLSFARRAQLGRRCKRLIDYGRLQFVKKHTNLQVEMVHYVDEDTSPENCLIVGHL